MTDITNTRAKYRLDINKTLVLDRVKVTLSHIGEGFEGDFDDTNPQDAPLLRMDVEVQENENGDEAQWVALDNGSYCTQLTCAANDDVLGRALTVMAEKITVGLREGRQKRTGEWLSWMSEDNIETFATEKSCPPY